MSLIRWADEIVLENVYGNIVQGLFMTCRWVDLGGAARLISLMPSAYTQAPLIARFKSGKAIHWIWT